MKSEGFSDLHQHVLWGLDDGPRTPDQMYALLARDMQEGIRLVFATTHAYPKTRPFDLSLYWTRLEEANVYCESMGWPLQVLPGCEIRYCSAVADHLAAGDLPSLGGSRRVLIEFGRDVSLHQIRDAADKLYRVGFLPVVAHVERYPCLARAPRQAMALREEYGLLYQMNCDTVLRPRGLREKRFVHRMLGAKAIDAIATDAHDLSARPPRLRAAYQKIARAYGVRYAGRLIRLGWRIATPE